MFRKLFGSIVFLFLSINAQADSAANLSQLLASVQTVQADFNQTLSDSHAKVLQQSVGHMALQRPGKFRWEVTKPVAQLIVANGSRLWIYDPDLEQVTIRLVNKEIGETPAFLLSNPSAGLDKNFKVQEIKNSASLHWFLLTPKKSDSMLAFIKMGFANNQIREMDLQDHLGHNTVIEFYNLKLNTPLSSSLFSFKPPANVDIIDETKG